MPDAALANLLARTVEEGHGKILLLQPVIVRGLPEGRNGQSQGEDGAAKAQCQPLAGRLYAKARKSGDMQLVHARGKGRIGGARHDPRPVERRIDPRIEVQKHARKPLA